MLSVKNLKVTYGRIAAITDVSFEVPEGKIVTLIVIRNTPASY